MYPLLYSLISSNCAIFSCLSRSIMPITAATWQEIRVYSYALSPLPLSVFLFFIVVISCWASLLPLSASSIYYSLDSMFNNGEPDFDTLAVGLPVFHRDNINLSSTPWVYLFTRYLATAIDDQPQKRQLRHPCYRLYRFSAGQHESRLCPIDYTSSSYPLSEQEF